MTFYSAVCIDHAVTKLSMLERETYLKDEIRRLQNKIFYLQMCDDESELTGAENLINEISRKIYLLKFIKNYLP